MADPSQPGPAQDELIQRFCEATGCPPREASHYLGASSWDPNVAATEYYMSNEPEAEETPDEEQDNDEDSTGASAPVGRTLDGRAVPQPIPTTSSASAASGSASKQPPKKTFATIGDLGGGGGAHAGHGHDDDSDDSEDQDFFAGGEKSGLAVQNPDELKRKILEKARRNQGRQPADETRAPPSSFTGTARTLGGDDTPSRVIEDPKAKLRKPPVKVDRRLHFWADGFSVDDGPLYRSDDPANAGILAMIKSGRAPLEIMNVEQHQEVEVKVEQHEGNYVAQKKKYKPFGSGGQRLGSPTPGAGTRAAAPAEAPAAPAVSTAPSVPTMDINEAEPTISLQIRLGDGTRLISRFNTSHTVGDVYSFVEASSPDSRSRPWALMTTFPTKELIDKSQALGDMSELKRGGTVVQKWQ
ncbi:hypothetical protein MMC30_005172 [Trapelia coarctata]|nr:hypothetical protein [Trapelia coarctata]